MGVPKFYRWISERYPCLSEVIRNEQIPEFDNLYLDMNGIIHGCTHPADEDISFRISEEQIFRDIFDYIDVLFGIIKPRKVFFMAIDGVAPRAKMNQQRARRFMSAKNMQEALNKAKIKGDEIPEEKPFDSNCITPGTQFMARLHKQLQYFVQMKITTDSCWQGLRIYLSGHNCPGEGEHKIMDFIRSERSHPDYDANTRHCLYGGDADLIMLGMCSHEPHFALLREEVKFGRPKSRVGKHRTGVDGITFHLLHLSLLREYLSWEFQALKTKLPFMYNLESIIDDWVLMGFLVGNDFIPHLPHVHIHEDALPLLYSTYIEVLPQLDGYINEAGILNLKRFEIFLKNFAKNDRKNFIEQMDDEAYLASKRVSNAWAGSAVISTLSESQQNCDEDLQPFDSSDIDDLEKTEVVGKSSHKGAFDSDSDVSEECAEISGPRILSATQALSHGCFGLDKDSDDDFPTTQLDDESYENDYDLSWTPSVNRAFKNHKRNYYNDKLKYKNISKEELRKQAEGYVRAIQWNLHYYYHGCCSWSWFYPHHYAPYISDVVDFAEMEMNFDLGEPLRPFEQLLAVLPAASADCLPLPFQELMRDPASPIIDFYPENFDTDLNGKKNDWEAVVLIPFVMEDRLLKAVATKEQLLNSEERQRNTHGPHLLFTYYPESPHILHSSLPGSFPDIQECTAKLHEVGINEFRIAFNRIVYGLLPGVKLDVIFAGFPTMKHIPHTAELHFADIRVFQQPSKKQSLILKIANRKEFEKDMLEIAFDLVGTEVHVNWPLLQKALVHELWTANKKYSKSSEEEIICDDLSKEEQDVYSGYVCKARKNEFERRGIDVGEQKGLALVRTVQGLQKCFEGKRVVTKRVYVDADNAVPVSLSLIVQNALEDWDASDRIEDAFPIDAKVFISSVESKYYGFCGLIKENHLETKGTLTVSCTIPSTADVSFYDLLVNYENYSLKWYSALEIARFLHTTIDAVSRITGCVYVVSDDVNESDVTSSSRNAGSLNKVNIGLELKFSKRNQVIPDFTRRSSEGYWLYSSRALNLIRLYKIEFPGVFRCIEKLDDFRGYIFVKHLFPELNGQEKDAKFGKLKKFLRSTVPTDALESGDATFVDSRVMKEVEKRTQAVLCRNTPKQICKRLAVRPRAIFRAEICQGDIMPDPTVEFRLLDRVICVRKLRTAPFGEFGTVIGLITSGTEKRIDVLFDKPYFGGKTMRSSKASGARLPLFSLINITHGKRMRKEIPMVEHVLKPRTTYHEPVDFPRSTYDSEEYSFRGSQSRNIFGTSSSTVPRNKPVVMGIECSGRNEWKPKISQIQSARAFHPGYGGVAGSEVEEQVASPAAHDFQEAKGKNAVASSGKRKLQARPPRASMGSSLGLETGRIKLEDQDIRVGGGGFGSKSYGRTPQESFLRNQYKTWSESKHTESRSIGNTEYRPFGFSRSRNTEFKYGTPGNVPQIRYGLGSSGNFDVEQARFSNIDRDESIGSGFASNLPLRRESEEIKKCHKLHHGYPRTWFGCKPVKSQGYLGLSSGGTSSKRIDSRFAQPIQLEEMSKSGKAASPASVTLLKRGEFLNVTELSLAAERSLRSEEAAERGREKEEKTSPGTNATDEMVELLKKQKLNTSAESRNSNELPESFSPDSVAMSVTVLSEVAEDPSSSQPRLVDVSSSEFSKKIVSRKSEETIFAQKPMESAAVASNERATSSEREGRRMEFASLHDTSSAVQTPNSGLPDISRPGRRRPRKSRLAANLGFSKEQLEEK